MDPATLLHSLILAGDLLHFNDEKGKVFEIESKIGLVDWSSP